MIVIIERNGHCFSTQTSWHPNDTIDYQVPEEYFPLLLYQYHPAELQVINLVSSSVSPVSDT